VQIGVHQQSPTYKDSGWERPNAWLLTRPGGAAKVVSPLEFYWTPKHGGFEGHYFLEMTNNTGGRPDLVLDIMAIS